jgi:hypothetical protein
MVQSGIGTAHDHGHVLHVRAEQFNGDISQWNVFPSPAWNMFFEQQRWRYSWMSLPSPTEIMFRERSVQW